MTSQKMLYRSLAVTLNPVFHEWFDQIPRKIESLKLFRPSARLGKELGHCLCIIGLGA